MAKQPKHKASEYFKGYDTARKPGETLDRYYKRLAKVADQRLVRLEQLAAKEADHYGGVLQYSYAAAMRDIAHFSGEGAIRFNTKAPENARQMQSKINAIIKFIESPTSSKQGITAVYKARAKTTNERFGTDFTWQDLAKFYESGEAERLDAAAGSSTIMRALGAIRRISKDPEKIKRVIEGKEKVGQDEIVQTVAKRLAKSGVYKLFT